MINNPLPLNKSVRFNLVRARDPLWRNLEARGKTVKECMELAVLLHPITVGSSTLGRCATFKLLKMAYAPYRRASFP